MGKFIRFTTRTPTEHGSVLAGIFAAVGELRRSETLEPIDSLELDEVERWFERRLREPSRFSLRHRIREPRVGVCWFRDTARKHLARAYELIEVLSRYGIHVDRVETTRPGVVIWEDEHQIVAVPYGIGRPSSRRRRRPRAL